MLLDPAFRELATLPLPNTVIKNLALNGYYLIAEISSLSTSEFASFCHISLESAQKYIKVLENYQNLFVSSLSKFRSVHDIISEKQYIENYLISVCKSVDNVLGGGFLSGRLTEICGRAGVGKTQFCLQLCANVQLPVWCNGLDGQAIFIDTEGNFVPKRFAQISRALVKHYQDILIPAMRVALEKAGLSEKESEIISPLHVEKMLSKVHYLKVFDHLELVATCKKLHLYCATVKNPPIRLIIVDSIAMPFRYQCENAPLRNKMLGNIAQSLRSLAQKLNAVVIITNQITTKINESKSSLVPALGDSWGHLCSVRVYLDRPDEYFSQLRTLSLIKHPASHPGESCYQITADGIRDVFQ